MMEKEGEEGRRMRMVMTMQWWQVIVATLVMVAMVTLIDSDNNNIDNGNNNKVIKFYQTPRPLQVHRSRKYGYRTQGLAIEYTLKLWILDQAKTKV
ncbi:unnamed protein product [Microthlaspi erraticum]|uniref:Transmembrane protein n=1 Tax=Microthlaspi erraticum TaxID=1685480 RepID=A0A6D2KY39_9BRAS|nr:unnamed protein product [Microthlaspi erraticum]